MMFRVHIIILGLITSLSAIARDFTITGAAASTVFHALEASLYGHVGRSSHFVGISRINDYLYQNNTAANFQSLYCLSDSFEGPICLFRGNLELAEFQRDKGILQAVGLITDDERRILRRDSTITGAKAVEMYNYIEKHLKDVSVSRGLPRGEHQYSEVIDVLGMRCVRFQETRIGEAGLFPYGYECRIGRKSKLNEVRALLTALGVDQAVLKCDGVIRN